MQLSEIRTELGSDAVGLLGLDEYQDMAVRTYRGTDDIGCRFDFLLLGLFGEVGSLLSELKKKQRDRTSYTAYSVTAVEETGDVLWYLSNLAADLKISLSELARQTGRISQRGAAVTFADLQPQAALLEVPASGPGVQRSLLRLAARAGRAVRRTQESDDDGDLVADLARVLDVLVNAADEAHVGLDRAARDNLEKLIGRWPQTRHWGELYDENDDPDERFPRQFTIAFRERQINGTRFAYQSMNGVNIGDRLTDNSTDEDDYRFHDVFHLAFAAILGWSPVLRSLLKVKRKSRPRIDEQQDGARAMIAEEGISNWLFAQGQRHEAFAHVDSLDFALLKTIRDMVKGYEVETRPMWMWEEAILSGFAIFRDLQRNRGGLVTADLEQRTLAYQAFE